MHEIVTLQFGQQANYVGTHFWNTQESYFTYGQDEESPVDHDVHFRPGVGSDGIETYTPRTVIYDLKGAFGTLRQENALYQLQSQGEAGQAGQWPGQAQVIQQPAIPQSDYQQRLNAGEEPPHLSTSSVRYWSDYNRVFYHPRSIVQLHEFELNSSLAPFERWHTGEELFSNLDKEHDLLDKDLRPFLEECDQLQGLQLLASTDDAWGGFASSYLERLRDELGKTSLWVWGLEDGQRKPRDRQLLSTTNVLHSISSLVASASLYIPLTTSPTIPSYITSFLPSSKWHTSALQLTALESVTLPSRLRLDNSSRTSLTDIEALLSNSGKRRMAQLSLSLSPSQQAPNGSTSQPSDARLPTTNGSLHHPDSSDDDPTTLPLDIDMAPTPPSLSPPARGPHSHNSPDQVFARHLSLRSTQPVYSSLEIADLNTQSQDRFSSFAAQGTRVSIHQSNLLFPVLSSFPRIFDFAEGEAGKVGVESALTAGTKVGRDLRAWERVGRRVLGVEVREEMGEVLAGLAGEYEEGFEGGSGSGDDD
ncbi:tubulin domain-containing protein [Elsinoe ampelina]|uniref:Tubulin domain-containing protein n=1 Tax=Elsinoe ampelina TaxID=302913 RepID=A0A6A6GAS1_9PEZI|nr:tubulin domain-containing protein [Elsinoe ampelina]